MFIVFNKGSACAEMDTIPGPIGFWEASDCTLRRGFICQTYKGKLSDSKTIRSPVES